MSIEEIDESKYMFSADGNKKNKSTTPVLDNFGKDLTKLAMAGKIEPAIGREKEIDRIIQVLSRKKKNNPVLVGKPGTGKCFCSDTEIILKNDVNQCVVKISVKDFLNNFPNLDL